MSALQELVLQKLQCKACFTYMQPPIRLCTKGHSACNTCAQKFTTCTVCSYPFMTTRNLALEELSYEVDIKCENCDFISNCSQMAMHYGNCKAERLIYKCTKEITQKNYLKKVCNWSGRIDEVYDHFKIHHEKSLYDVTLGTESKFHWKLPFKQDQIDINVIHTKLGNFLNFVYYTDSFQSLYFAVINIEMKKEKFNFEIHIDGEDKIFERKVEEEYMTVREMIENERYIKINLNSFKYFKNKERNVYWGLVIRKV